MKKKITLFVCLLFTLNAFAQDESSVRKVLLVDNITHSSNIKRSYSTMLKFAILEGINNTKRLSLIDAETESSLKIEEKRRSSESSLDDDKARTEKIRKLGADFMMNIHVTDMDAEKREDDDNKIYYSGMINFTLTILHVKDGTIFVSKLFAYKDAEAEKCSTSEEAMASITDYIKSSMNNFIQESFKIEASIISIESVDKKRKKATTVFINCGDAVGVIEEQLFDVYVVTKVAGREGRKKIGQLEVVEIHGDNMTLCKVKNGGEEIRNANENQSELPVLSNYQKTKTLVGGLWK